MIALDDFRGGLPSYESLEELERLDAQGGTETVDLGLGDGYGVAILGGTYATKKIPQVVWEKVLKETRHVKRVSETERVFGFLGEEQGILLIGQQNPNGWVFHKANKHWGNNRESEVFALLQQGFERATEQEFNEVSQLLKTT